MFNSVTKSRSVVVLQRLPLQTEELRSFQTQSSVQKSGSGHVGHSRCSGSFKSFVDIRVIRGHSGHSWAFVAFVVIRRRISLCVVISSFVMVLVIRGPFVISPALHGCPHHSYHEEIHKFNILSCLVGPTERLYATISSN